MNFDPGTIIAVAAALLFYLRLIILQRQKVKMVRENRTARPVKRNGKSKPAPALAGRPGLIIANKVLVFGGMVLILIGAAAAGIPTIDAALRAAWWLPVTLGILLMSIGIR